MTFIKYIHLLHENYHIVLDIKNNILFAKNIFSLTFDNFPISNEKS